MHHTKRLGIFGGSFDPPHLAHIALAQHAIAQFKLDELRIIPTGDAWHKTRPLTASPHRLAMTRLAFATIPEVVVDTREIDRPGPTYTVDTLLALQAEQPDARLFLLMGADQARVFHTWHRWQEIETLATLVVAQRPAPKPDANLAPGQAHDAQWHNAVSPDAQRLDMPSLNVSATEIRAHFAQAQLPQPDPMSAWLPASVQHYIEKHSLYRSN